MIRVSDIGWIAHDVLRAGAPAPRVLAALRESTYLMFGETVLWLGPHGAPLHGRAILTPDEPTGARRLRFLLDGVQPWRPSSPKRLPASILQDRLRALLGRLDRLGTPRGLGRLLAGVAPPPLLEDAVERVDALAWAFETGDVGEVVRASTPLIGLGPGLTPAGDDVVGGAFFTRFLMDADERHEPADWQLCAEELLARAATATHPISHQLLGDLFAGHGHGVLHAFAEELTRGPSLKDLLESARNLVELGHSSGWDLLTGMAVAVLGREACYHPVKTESVASGVHPRI